MADSNATGSSSASAKVVVDPVYVAEQVRRGVALKVIQLGMDT